MTVQNESHPFYILSNGKLPHCQVDLHDSQLATKQYYQVTVETEQKDLTEDESKLSYVRDR